MLALLAHPDDMELCCSGTLIKYKKQGHDVIACHACNGNMGHMVIMPPELREIRIIRYANPDVIITHNPGDYMVDHVELSKLVFNVSFSASCPHFKFGFVTMMSWVWLQTNGCVRRECFRDTDD